MADIKALKKLKVDELKIGMRYFSSYAGLIGRPFYANTLNHLPLLTFRIF